jgi:hypothetical protein
VPRGYSPKVLLRWGKEGLSSIRFRRELRRIDVETVERAGWTRLRDTGCNFQVIHLYVTVDEQLTQFAASSWKIAQILDLNGRPVDPRRPPEDPYLTYLCQAITPGSRATGA